MLLPIIAALLIAAAPAARPETIAVGLWTFRADTPESVLVVARQAEADRVQRLAELVAAIEVAREHLRMADESRRFGRTFKGLNSYGWVRDERGVYTFRDRDAKEGHLMELRMKIKHHEAEMHGLQNNPALNLKPLRKPLAVGQIGRLMNGKMKVEQRFDDDTALVSITVLGMVMPRQRPLPPSNGRFLTGAGAAAVAEQNLPYEGGVKQKVVMEGMDFSSFADDQYIDAPEHIIIEDTISLTTVLGDIQTFLRARPFQLESYLVSNP